MLSPGVCLLPLRTGPLVDIELAAELAGTVSLPELPLAVMLSCKDEGDSLIVSVLPMVNTAAVRLPFVRERMFGCTCPVHGRVLPNAVGP